MNMAVNRDRERKEAQRNQNPHAEAILAMCLWNDEYAFKQRGGVMDFWDAIGPQRQKQCRELVDRIVRARREPEPLIKRAPHLPHANAEASDG